MFQASWPSCYSGEHFRASWPSCLKDFYQTNESIWFVSYRPAVITGYKLPYFFSYKTEGFFSFRNNPNNLDPSNKMDLDLWDCLGRVKLVL